MNVKTKRNCWTKLKEISNRFLFLFHEKIFFQFVVAQKLQFRINILRITVLTKKKVSLTENKEQH